MIINIGSVNPTKIEAVKEIILRYDFLKDTVINEIESPSNISPQPKSIEETVTGAKNRAKNVFSGYNYSIGLESGLLSFVDIEMEFPRWMNFTACAIYDGKHYAVGFSPAFEIPPVMARFILEKGCEIDEAVYQMGLSTEKRVGYKKGLIAILSKGLLTRKDYMKPAIEMAMIQLQSKELYY